MISGPRQVGKTTLAKQLIESPQNYFNWDLQSFRKLWNTDPENILAKAGPGPIALDEIHKDRKWKSKIKGLYDVYGSEQRFIATGSARLDIFRQGGDSLLGRFQSYHLHQISVGESPSGKNVWQGWEPLPATHPLNLLLQFGGFPEPFFGQSRQRAMHWSRQREERLIEEDIRDLRNIRDLRALRVLCDFLPDCVGSILSVNSLRENVGVAYATVRDWIEVLSQIYYLFLITPYSKSLRRMVTAEPKMYLYDSLLLRDDAKRLENMTALHLLKSCHYWTDSAQGRFDLHFLRNKDKKEVDFLIVRDSKPWMLVECKSGKKTINPTMVRFKNELNTPHNLQLVFEPGYYRYDQVHNIHIADYEAFFAQLV